jgi:hypothetical protein
VREHAFNGTTHRAVFLAGSSKPEHSLRPVLRTLPVYLHDFFCGVSKVWK